MKNITSDNSLSLVAFNLTEQQQKIALLIFESAEYKPKSTVHNSHYNGFGQ
jgi:hypothetical protein